MKNQKMIITLFLIMSILLSTSFPLFFSSHISLPFWFFFPLLIIFASFSYRIFFYFCLFFYSVLSFCFIILYFSPSYFLTYTNMLIGGVALVQLSQHTSSTTTDAKADSIAGLVSVLLGEKKINNKIIRIFQKKNCCWIVSLIE